MKRFSVPSSSSSEQSEVPDSSDETECGKRKTKYRKYDETYLDHGFTCVEVNNEEHPQCVICLKVLPVESMLLSKLKDHIERLHPHVVGKPREFFIRKLKEVELQKSTFSKQSKVDNSALLSSYKVAYRVAQSKQPHTIAEELILPAAVEMVTIMLGEDAGKQLLKVPLSNDAISQRINDMAEDIGDQLICNLKGKEFAIQLNEATDSQEDTYLICYVRFVNEKKIVEDLLFCKEMKGETTSENVFEVVDDFMVQNQIDWERCVGVCTDGSGSMAGCYQGLRDRIRSKAPNVVWTHCMIHREALAAENLSEELHGILKIVIKVVNFIKTSPMKKRFFAKLCDDIGAEQSCLLFYSSSQWLSLGNSLLRLYELRNEIYSYLRDEEHCFADKFIDTDFLIKLAFLSDLFEKLNALSKSLQGRNTNIFQLLNKVSELKKKVILWKKNVNKGDYKSFPSLDQFLQANEMALKEELRTVFVLYFSQLHLHLENFFPEDEVESIKWVRDPFNAEIPPHFNNEEAEQLIDVSTDSTLKIRFRSQSLPEFWCQTENEYPVISKRALRVLILFANTYLCETGFSAVAVIKSKYRTNINIENEMRVAISKITPRFDELSKQKQAVSLWN
ncbi:SCAN domain-containing protein 3-like [Tiliqua scincoides]|uniref:SCAN domain-containing protein 3-like n=1 Tax=Tiliqua scincoides TaxID=71010 RepID=UPI0034636538